MKNLFLFAAFAALLAGCSNDKQVGQKNPGGESQIGFRPVTSKSMRAAETDATNIRDFKVFGFWDADYEFMYDVNVVRGEGNTWAYSPLRYWPSTGDVDFYAYSPAGSRGVVIADMFTKADTDPVISYVVPTANALQEDFLVSAAPAQNQTANAGEVQLTFDHVLSQMVFEARSDVQDVIFNVSAIEFTGMQTNATLDLSDVASGWNLTGVTATFADFSAPISTLPVIYDADATKFIRITGPSDGLMILPQPLAKPGDGVDANGNAVPDDLEADAGTIYLVITYSAQLNSGAVIVPAGTKVYLPLTSVPDAEFKMGKKYVFQLDMSTGLTPVSFSVTSVNAWDTDLDGDDTGSDVVPL